MRKIIYIMSVIFFTLLDFSCHSYNSEDMEKISVSLPEWPPEDCCKDFYPELSRWKITITSCEKSTILFYNGYSDCSNDEVSISQNKIVFNVNKNLPLTIIAEPITKSTPENESLFFKPAGFIYPYEKESNTLSWSQGFLCSIMNSLFINCKNQKLSKYQINKLLSEFNWYKAGKILDEKINNKSEMYNPWLLNKENILNKICEKKFTSIYFNLSSDYEISNPDANNKTLLCSFPPCNKTVENQLLLVKKDLPQQFLYSDDTTLTITYNSSKKVSLEHQFLPIYIEGYETD